MNCQCQCDNPPAAYSRNPTDRSWAERYYEGEHPDWDKWEYGRVFDNTTLKETAVGLQVEGVKGWFIKGPSGSRWVRAE